MGHGTAAVVSLPQRPPTDQATVRQRCARQLVRAGVDQSRYSTHSFRIRAATTAEAKGIEDAVIKTLGKLKGKSQRMLISACLTVHMCTSFAILIDLTSYQEWSQSRADSTSIQFLSQRLGEVSCHRISVFTGMPSDFGFEPTAQLQIRLFLMSTGDDSRQWPSTGKTNVLTDVQC